MTASTDSDRELSALNMLREATGAAPLSLDNFRRGKGGTRAQEAKARKAQARKVPQKAANASTTAKEPENGMKGQTPTFSLRERALTRSALAALPTPDPLIEETIERRTVIVVAGPFGTGKSFLSLAWALSIATGTPWLGRKVEHPGPVLYVASEGAYGLDARVTAWERHNDRAVTDDELLVVPFPINLRDGREAGELAAMAEGRSLVVFDTLARCLVGADENSNRDMGEAIENCYRIRERTNGGSVLLAHHTTKDGVTTRGASALEDGVETVYKTSGDDRLIKLNRTKRKDGPREDIHQFRIHPVDFTDSCVLMPTGPLDPAATQGASIFRPTGLMEAVSDLLMERQEGLSKQQIRTLIKGRDATIIEAIEHLIHEGYVTDKRPHRVIRPFRRVAEAVSGPPPVPEVCPQDLFPEMPR
jgi:predicted ATP-dependent serine protease